MNNEFDDKALEWDKNRMHLERTKAVALQLQKMVPFRPGMKAMEFGAGTGLLSFYLKEQFSAITLVDSSKEMLKMAELKMEGNDRLKFNTLFIDLERDDYSGEPFDIIYSQMVLHHISDIGAIIKKFNRMLSPGGVLAIADLYSEDGSFHDGNPDVHKGFDPAVLEGILLDQGFRAWRTVPCFIITKELADGKTREYPVFLMTGEK
jgi:tRNA (cmo5U34)-methyltransferase